MWYSGVVPKQSYHCVEYVGTLSPDDNAHTRFYNSVITDTQTGICKEPQSEKNAENVNYNKVIPLTASCGRS